mgnify:CR=1 FL=1
MDTTSGPTSHEPAPPDTPQSNLSGDANPNPIPADPPDITTPAPSTTTEPLDDMTFTGAWCAPVIHQLDVDVSVCGYTPTPATFRKSETNVNTSVIERENKNNIVCETHANLECNSNGIVAGEDLKLPSDSIQSTYLIMKILFWFSAIFWDTVAYFILSSPSDTPACTLRRCKQNNILYLSFLHQRHGCY